MFHVYRRYQRDGHCLPRVDDAAKEAVIMANARLPVDRGSEATTAEAVEHEHQIKWN